MARARDPNRDKAYQLYAEKGGLIDLIEIARQLGASDGTVRGWKNKDRWDDKMNGTFQSKVTERNEKGNGTVKGTERNGTEKKKKKEPKLPKVEPIPEKVKNIISNTELNDKQKLFCVYFAKSFNATRSYQKAYGCTYESAMCNGPRLLGNDRVKEEIDRVKAERYANAYIKPEDIFAMYMKIAFADVTDYLEFGQEEVPVMTMYGPLIVKDEETGEKTKITKIINTVRFKESAEVDGSIISEVKQGKDGASIKLADRMKALDWLTEHMNMATEEQKARIAAYKAKSNDDVDEEETGVVMIADVLEDKEE